MKLWEDEKTIEFIANLSGWERLLRGFELTEFSYKLLGSGIRNHLKTKNKKKITKTMQKILWETEKSHYKNCY